MKYMRLFTGPDKKSHFETLKPDFVERRKLGSYSKAYPVSSLMFREFNEGLFFDWHCAPRAQYIVYLEGQVEVATTSGQKFVFNPGDVLLAEDITGEGHTTKTLTSGRSLVIPAGDEQKVDAANLRAKM